MLAGSGERYTCVLAVIQKWRSQGRPSGFASDPGSFAPPSVSRRDVRTREICDERTPGAWRFRLVLAVIIVLGVCWAFRARPSLTPASTAPQEVLDRRSFSARVSLQEPPRERGRPKPSLLDLEVHGYVFTSEGAPVEHAMVCSVATLERCCDDDPCVDTDSAGRFEFPAVLEVGGSLVASAPGYVTVTQDIEWGHGGASVAQEMRLKPASSSARLRGAVYDVYGGPVAGAVVSMASALTDERQGVTVSEADGTFVLTVERGAGSVCARAEAYARVCQGILAPSDGNTIVLVPASRISGRVMTAATAEGIAGATVRAINWDGLSVPVNAVRSDTDGGFRFDALPAGAYLLTAISEQARSTDVSVTVGVGETKEPVILTASPSVRFSATVLLGGEPCPGAEVLLAGPVDGFAVVGTEGKASIDGLVPGAYRANAVCHGRRGALSLDIADRPVHHLWTFDASSEGSPRQANEPELIAQGGTIRVRVNNPEAVDGPVRIFANAGSPMPLRARQSGGEFIFDDVPIGHYRVHPFDDVEHARSVGIRRAGEVANVQVTLRERGAIFGRVVDPGGAPVSEAWVRHSREGVPDGDAMVGSPVLADENGAFILPVTSRAAYSIVVNSPVGGARLRGARSGAPIEIRVSAPAAP